MPLDLTDAREDAPAAIAGLEAAPESSLLDVKDAREVTPANINNITVAPMPEVVAAGVTLAKCVLMIMTGALLVLFVYLGIMDYRTGSDISPMYDRIINPNKIGAEIYTLSEFDRMITDLSDLTSGKSASISDAARTNIKSVISLVDKLRSIPLSEKNIIKNCDAIPSDDTKAQFIKQCVDSLEGVRQAAVDASSGIADAQIAADFAGKVIDERAALHSFWIQSAQLILLNLLLPLLTGLFGYVFGTQQGNVRPQ